MMGGGRGFFAFVAVLMFKIGMGMHDDCPVRKYVGLCENSLVDIGKEDHGPHEEQRKSLYNKT
jgi:hypothetical protein